MSSTNKTSRNEQSPNEQDTQKALSPTGDPANSPLTSTSLATSPKPSALSSPSVLLIDPTRAFRHKLEIERRAAIEHEGFIQAQISALETELASVRRVIDACDAALVKTNGE